MAAGRRPGGLDPELPAVSGRFAEAHVKDRSCCVQDARALAVRLADVAEAIMA
jgi:hypothetical protein